MLSLLVMQPIPMIVLLLVLGVILWLIKKYVPIPEPIFTIIIVIIALGVLFWLLAITGIWKGGFQLQ